VSEKNLSLFGGKRQVLTVSEITQQIKKLLASSFRELWISGEVSNLTYHRSGHVYFTLKDEGSSIRCVLWRSAARKLRFKIEEGSEIVVLGDISVYESRGEYQLKVVHAEPKGIGALALAFEQLKKKLAAEGLFDQDIKKPLPYLPRKIGIITSPTGAAVRDIVRTILGRFPNAHIILNPVKVQGESAAEEIAEAIATFNRMKEVDVIISGRGGGSLEDLWPFNEEIVARAIFDSIIPVISAVGHEVDVTISDYVADARAATPTAAGQLVVPNEEDLRLALEQLRQRMVSALRNAVLRLREKLDRLSNAYALRRPMEIVEQRMQRLDETWRRTVREIDVMLSSKRNSLNSAKSHLESLNPRNVLARGYSITSMKGDSQPLKSSAGINPGQFIETILSEGTIVSRVKEQ